MLLLAGTLLHAQENLNHLTADLTVPPLSEGNPSPGKRVKLLDAKAAPLLYLPVDWTPQRKWPVIFEYPGNGGYSNPLGDKSDGTAEGCVMGYGLSGGKGIIWVSLPFVNADGTEATTWWGDIPSTKRLCLEAVGRVLRDFAGDEKRLILAGFSRGAIACNYIGLHDDEMASLWCGMICHSHYDGVRETWPYPEANRASALARLKRLGTRPQWISHEQSTHSIQAWLKSTGLPGKWTFEPLLFPNHTARWTLCETELRRKARTWLHQIIE